MKLYELVVYKKWTSNDSYPNYVTEGWDMQWLGNGAFLLNQGESNPVQSSRGILFRLHRGAVDWMDQYICSAPVFSTILDGAKRMIYSSCYYTDSIYFGNFKGAHLFTGNRNPVGLFTVPNYAGGLALELVRGNLILCGPWNNNIICAVQWVWNDISVAARRSVYDWLTLPSGRYAGGIEFAGSTMFVLFVGAMTKTDETHWVRSYVNELGIYRIYRGKAYLVDTLDLSSFLSPGSPPQGFCSCMYDGRYLYLLENGCTYVYPEMPVHLHQFKLDWRG